ncbi:phosphoglycerate kinase [Candidatus Pelagibacter ubique HTCC1002]|uniref:Phosphoglycerate kinase n=1 Tax=Pelagibacter ubique (strain HTCC1002) TaxID=314261 RepID=Q1V1Z6_PELU1|nr:phosphoglycerate kinase [Candidatus Pelagibacter ubique]EAS84732.1 phosphoglycerate kinase [Candidatus Pelagibacter ubique HTCC1002]
MRNIQDETNLNQKKVLLRLDLNVPLDNGKITDTTRIDKILPTINFLLKNEAKIIILSHVGRPKGKVVSELSLKPICEDLKNKLNENIRLISKNIKEINSNDLFNEQDEKIVTLENLRFYEEEEKNDNGFAKHLASLADIYVNDAFSCSHRAHASIFEITKFIPSYAGLQLNLEIDALTKITSEIQRPITCIIGGSKISSKINIIKNLITKFDNIVIVGGMANNILKYKECEIGKSIQEDNCDKIIEEIFSLSKKENCKIIYPEDVAVGKSLEGSAEIKELNNISKDELILDIGPKTIKAINLLIEESSTILWNGPAGYFENPNFAKGSIEIAKKIIEKNKNNTIYSVAGGGDTVSLLNGIGAINNFNFVSTAGGAFLEYLEGKELPGIKALN